ncbi:serine metalloprotease MrpA [Caballeronia hypogeia]|uniref:Serine metalloprotease MrpA n=1 Tax=Caballeronia hypogeia TaxID=1777140 RepID=A0A158BN32_9BURK|nr:S8 family serine peptidase [Caballeronia hypogeia]SAK70697.1 serine metalloprotease MrpA [Caballeronia hypogeia]
MRSLSQTLSIAVFSAAALLSGCGGGGDGGGSGSNASGTSGRGISGGGTSGGGATGGGTSGGGTTGGGTSSGSTGGGTLTPPKKPDPLEQYQWHLKNTGQNAFAGVPGVSGFDLNVDSLYQAGMTGKGVKVSVLDSGVDAAHEDLAANIDPNLLATPTADGATIGASTLPESHGTAVAGLIGAVAGNGVGVRGVAPGVTLGAISVLGCTDCGGATTDPATLGGASYSSSIDIFSGSFGMAPTAPVEYSPFTSSAEIALNGLQQLRQGKGAVYIRSAGNYYAYTRGGSCTTSRALQVSCGNANLDAQRTSPVTILVAAVNAQGKHSSYSSAGSNILVSGFGGEFGYADPSKKPAGPALVTTDVSGCSRGAVKTDKTNYRNDFDTPGTAINLQLNASCNYMSTMNGTSAAAPTVTGVVALMLQANPNLTWRDVRVILASTARQIDVGHVAPTTTLPSGETYTPEPAWLRNAAGMWFDNLYGFGLVDAAAAVAMARSYTSYLTGPMKESGQSLQFESANGTSIAMGKVSGTEFPITLGGSVPVSKVESVRVVLTLGNATPGDLAVELISPSGTRSVLLQAYNVLQGTDISIPSMTLASNVFLGEPAKGVWKLRLIDVNRRDGDTPMVLQRAIVNVMGS